MSFQPRNQTLKILPSLPPQDAALNGTVDDEYMDACAAEGDPAVTLESVREALSKIPGSMTAAFSAERDE
jgi:hypothetical protein